MIVLGLTGGLAMGKSTVANMFAQEKAAVHNADEMVHHILESDPVIIDEIKTRWPQAFVQEHVSRKILGDIVFHDEKALKMLEAMIHPRVAAAELDFINQARHAGKWLVVLDIPLLYETGAESRLDYVAVVSAPPDVQRQRAFARKNMTEDKFQQILAHQMPDEKKRLRADFIIDTYKPLEETQARVLEIIEELEARNKEKANA